MDTTTTLIMSILIKFIYNTYTNYTYVKYNDTYTNYTYANTYTYTTYANNITILLILVQLFL